ncbi:MAG: hypothetical protein JNL50_09505 [Phycisphaerae bacterium]|nr:hypothetical protein [Phycisphaerae bacterium]
MASSELRTFRAPTMAAALAEVKKALGGEAVILHTRSHKVGGVMGVGAKQLVEITASAPKAGAGGLKVRVPSRPARTAVGAGVGAGVGAAGTRGAAPAAEFGAVGVGTVGFGATRGVEREGGELAGVGGGRLATRADFSPQSTRDRVILEEELASIKKLVGQVLQCSRQTAAHVAHPGGRAGASSASAAGVLSLGPMSEPLFANYMRLCDAGVPAELAEEIAGDVRGALTPSQIGDAAVVRSAVLTRLATLMPVVGSMSTEAPGDGRARTIALVGPTGVGKTTTLAKLAALYKLRHGKRVGLITSDTYRIAAVDQLKTYASIIDVPLCVAMTPEEMGEACRELRGCEVVLIDTAGRSQHDATRLDELRAFLEACGPHETHLALSVTAADTVMYRAAERFGAMSPDRILLTKLDEAVNFGAVAGLWRRTGLPVSFVTLGQEVPDQIELAKSERLARTVLDGEVVS